MKDRLTSEVLKSIKERLDNSKHTEEDVALLQCYSKIKKHRMVEWRMKKVTLWYKITRNGKGDVMSTPFNHLDDGWKEEIHPLPKSKSYTNQVAWGREEWLKQWAYLTDDFVVERVKLQ